MAVGRMNFERPRVPLPSTSAALMTFKLRGFCGNLLASCVSIMSDSLDLVIRASEEVYGFDFSFFSVLLSDINESPHQKVL